MSKTAVALEMIVSNVRKTIIGESMDSLERWCLDNGLCRVYAKQAMDHVYKSFCSTWFECKSFDQEACEQFDRHWSIDHGRSIREQISRDGTVKWLRELSLNGQPTLARIESKAHLCSF